MSARKDRALRKLQAKPEPVAPAAPPAPPIDWRRHGVVAAALCLLVLAAYSNSLHSAFVFDNKPVILDDPRVRSGTPANIDAIWSQGYWFDKSDPNLYRPLTTLSYLFNYAILGNRANPVGYHWINLTLHAVNALLVYLLGLVLFRRIAPSAALSALWAVHPVLTESVTNIVGRADLLSCAGVLAGLLCRVKAESAAGVRRIAWLAALAMASGIAILSKESGIVLIASILIYDFAYRKGFHKASIPAYAAVVLPVAAFLYKRSQVLAALPLGTPPFINNPLVAAGFLHGRLTAIRVIGRYMLLILWPRYLSCDYSYNQIPVFRGTFDNWGDWAAILGLLACLAAVWLAAVLYRRSEPGFFFIALFFIALAPVANVAMLVGTIMAERFLYLPAVGFVGLAVWGIYALADRWKGRWPGAPVQAMYVIAVVCAALLIRTHLRNSDWADDRTLFESAVKVSPGSYKTHLNLAVMLGTHKASIDRAIAEGEIALAILKPLPPEQDDDALTYSDLGVIYRTKGDQVRASAVPDSAASSRQWYRKALAVLTRGIAVDRQRSAEFQRRSEASGRTGYLFGSYGLYRDQAQAFLRMGEPQNAIEPLEYANLLHPDPLLFHLASEAYAALHDQNNAALALMEGLMIQPDQRAFASELVDLYQKEPPNCAVQKVGGSTSLNLECPLVHGQFCTASKRLSELYDRRGELSEARKVRNTAVQSFGCPAQ